MRIINYDPITELAGYESFLTDSNEKGSKKINATNLAKNIPNLLTTKEQVSNFKAGDLTMAYDLGSTDKILIGSDSEKGLKKMHPSSLYYAMFGTDGYLREQKRCTYRGASLGATLTGVQKERIKNGNFEDMFIGDSWYDSESQTNWTIVDFDYWYNLGDTSCQQHHVVVMPITTLRGVPARMNDTDITTGGYYSSKMNTVTLADDGPVDTLAKKVFGTNILQHREYLVNAVDSSGKPSGYAWYDSKYILPNEHMIYGCDMVGENGDKSPLDKKQLALFKYTQRYMSYGRSDCWLRDIVSGTQFAMQMGTGIVIPMVAHTQSSIRPVFGVTG